MKLQSKLNLLIVSLLVGILVIITFTKLKDTAFQKLLYSKTTYEPLMASPTPFPVPSGDAKKWMLAAGGIIAVQNQEGLEDLESSLPKDELKQNIAQSWNIYTRDDALAVIKWLKSSGHGKEFDKLRKYLLAATGDNPETYQKIRSDVMKEILIKDPQIQSFLVDFTWENRHTLATKNLIAWDSSRLINVSRWSYTLGLISKEEAWDAITEASLKIQSNYSSWDDLAEGYITGRTFWMYTKSHPRAESAIDWLKNNPDSPWKTLPWKLKLI